MTLLKVCLRLWLPTTILMSGFAATALADEPFEVDTASRLLYPLRAPADHFAIAIAFDQFRYALSAVTMQPTSNGPGGAPLVPDEDATVSLASDTATGHVVLEVKPKPESFRFPGEYRLALNLVGRTLDAAAKPITSNVTLSITRLEPQIDVDAMSGKSTTLYRLFPWNAASGTIQYPLQTLKSSDSAELSVSALGLNWVMTKELVPNAMIDVTPAHFDLQPGTPKTVVVTFSSLQYAGDFDTTLAFDSDSFAARRTLSIAVHVKDSPWMPLMAILLGVIGGAAVTWMSGEGRSAVSAGFRLTEMRLRLQKLAPAIVFPTSAAQYHKISLALDGLERSGPVENIAAADVAVIVSELAALEKVLAATQAQVSSKLNQLDGRVASVTAALAPDVRDIDERTRALSGQVAAIRAMNRGGQYEYAAQQAAAVEIMFQSLCHEARVAAVEDLSLKISAYLPSGADKNLTSKINELRHLAAGATMDDFLAALSELHRSLVGLGIEAQKRPLVTRSTVLPVTAAGYAVSVNTSERGLVTGQLIDLQVTVENGRPSPDRVVWNFGNGTLDVVSGELRASLAYEWPGPYTVTVQLYRDTDAAFHETAAASLTIKAGSAARQAVRAVSGLARKETLLVGIAVILAAVTGMLQLYVDKSFGSTEDYLLALLWGFAVENAIRGFNVVYATLGKNT